MWGRGGQTGGVFQTCEFNIQQPSSKSPAVHAKKGQTSSFHVSSVQLEMSQLCHKRTKHAWCLFFQRSLNSNKRKIFTSGRGRRQRVGVEEAKFRWQIIAVAVCPIMVLPLLALTDPIKERKPRVKTAILLLIDPIGPDKTHTFTFAPFIMMEQSG